MKITELTGAALDWAVAKCEGYLDLQPMEYWFSPAGIKHFIDMRNAEGHGVHWTHSSTDWAEGGPIIERELIELQYNGEWKATNQLLDYGSGTAPLIAAMRCYVASKLGEEVDVPTELTGGK